VPLLITQPTCGFALLTDGDIDFSARRMVRLAGVPGLVQRVRVRLKLVREELFYNQDIGVTWYAIGTVPKSKAIMGGKFSPEKTRAALRPAILGANGVKSITKMVFDFDAATRELAITWAANTIWGPMDPDTIFR
jgi:hypothetical protein